MSKKKKILLLSDDLRMFSGIACQSRELVLSTVEKYDWVQIGGSVKHPDKGKVFDLAQSIKDERGIDNAYVKVYPVDGYGNPDILNQIMEMEKPDAILHFTDPRFWGWLYGMEREIRKKIPLTYLNIWDDVPAPMWNRPFYKSCDALFSISKQTLNINKLVLGDDYWVMAEDVNSPEDAKGKSILHYVPHGIDPKVFKPLKELEYADVKNKLFEGNDYKFVFFYNNRNIRRKQTSNIILAYRMFCDSLPKEEAKKCLLLMHTHMVDNSGTDLPAVVEALCPEYEVKFSSQKLSPDDMNKLYNIADVTVNMASNEGFGLSGAESLITGTPIISNTTGGLQDHMGFRDEKGNLVEFTKDWGSNHDGRYKKHGKWAKPLYPVLRIVQGSPPTPYIFDDHSTWEDLAHAMMYWYKMDPEKRAEYGELGRQFALGEGGFNTDNLSKQFIFAMEKVFDNFTPRADYDLHTSDEFVGHDLSGGPGFTIPTVDMERVEKELQEIYNDG
jgi:glycosyltransferase involved in cell wall biosynthesis